MYANTVLPAKYSPLSHLSRDVNEYMKDHIFELWRKIWVYD